MRRPLRRFVQVVIWIVALAPPVAAVGYLLYANLLDPRVVQRLTGSYDGLYWDAAQLQIAYARFETQLMLYADGVDTDLETVRLRYAVLQSKLNVMKGSTLTLSGMPALMERQQRDLAALEAAIAPFDDQLAGLETAPSRAVPMADVLRAHWTEVTDLSLNRRYADISEREDIRRDFIAKRRELFAAGIVLIALSAAAAVLLVMNGYRRTRLLRQQRAALEAEAQASRAAREASTAKDAFLGMISHELRTPLHAIVSSIELLGLNRHTEADRKVIVRLETAARQLETQMKDLTDYARLGAGKLDLREEQFDPRELLQSIADQNEAAAHARSLAFEHAWRGPAQPVVSDPHRIRQIANNLVTNAIRYTGRGKVRIEFALAGRALSIAVSDTGPGVPPEQIPLIFKEFTQLDASRSRRYEGAGMGLAIVRGLVDLFGGTIKTDSRVGEGTTFIVTVPVVPVAVPAASGRAPAADGAPSRPRVLVVDDNPLVRESLCEMAAHMGYAALEAEDADSALARVATQPCDVVLLDLHMPGRDGYAFLAGLDAGAVTGLRPHVIAVSADVAALTAGGNVSPFFEYLTKPVHYEELRGALQRALVAPRAKGPR
ncbi:hybrid sensor histidine kinase/response regulator [Paraburkholderia sp. J12]|uniref:ATP-binding response regulator n=1 Tax=Paraburkholderia sp. J12 TaxID=2805432 RepID=UPI002ABD680B|nr:ATP-binding protein [Paraburkholderia sp. J12]